MKKIRVIVNFIFKLNLKTIRFNFTYFVIRKAIRFPVYISRHTYLKKLKGTVTISDEIKTFQIRLGEASVGIFDEKHSRFIWQVSGKVNFKGKAFMGQGCKISVAKEGELHVGDKVNITAETSIIAHKKVTIGDNSLLSWNILIMDTDFHTLKNNKGDVLNKPAPIVIGDHVWIGCNCIILKKAQIANNTVVAANTLINSIIEEENQLIGGLPDKVLKSEIYWEV